MKGGEFLSAKGYVQVRAYSSNALIPLKDVAVVISDASGAAIAMRLTDRSGLLNAPVEIPVPDLTAGQSPDTGVLPYSSVNLYARKENYEEIFVRNLQVFPETITEQNLEMIPLSEYPDSWIRSEEFNTPPQNL